LPPDGKVRTRQFVEDDTTRWEPNELPAALQIGLHDATRFLRRGILTPKWGDSDRQLPHADAGDINPELGVNSSGNEER
jgi:hypothetical protein